MLKNKLLLLSSRTNVMHVGKTKMVTRTRPPCHFSPKFVALPPLGNQFHNYHKDDIYCPCAILI